MDDFDAGYWKDKLGDTSKLSLDTKLHMILSLVIFLGVSIRHLLSFIFTTDIKPVKDRAARFLGYTPSYADPNSRFPAAHIFSAGVLQDSNRIITDMSLQIRIQDLTIACIRELLDPSKLADKYRALAPFFFELLHVFVASPNKYRKYNMDKGAEDGSDGPEENSGEENDNGWDDDPNEDHDEAGYTEAENTSQWQGFEGFSRNPIFAIIVAISMLAFVRNRATNLLPLLLCLFFKISGTSTRVIRMLSNIGVCVSGRTAEPLKQRISDDAIRLGVALVHSGRMWMTIFDNINIFLRKSQQRLTNRNSMIHATNVAFFALDGIDLAAENLKSKLDLRGERRHATVEDILPTNDDDTHMEQSFIALIAEILILYCPGNGEWKDRQETLAAIEGMMPTDRPLEPKKTDVRPFGVFDVNEGSKKGVIDVIDAIRERSEMSKTDWASKARIIQGDWLTANNFRNGRRIRKDDVNSFERMEYGDELSALFHHALQASHMIMKVHYGHAIRDPMSLAAHKGMLNRTWDVNKPNYAASKSLIRHSLIARVLHCVMVKKGFKLISQLKAWRPTLDDIKLMSTTLFEEFTTTTAAETAKAANDDYFAHSVYFIRDALFFCKFEKSVSIADAGAVMRVLKYWALAFRGAGQHNYARECVEVIVRSKYEMTDALRLAREQAWFYNRWGIYGRSIAADLYLEQNNYWVKRVFIADGNGVTIEYIIAKGSASVEAFREISHSVANFFGDSDRARRHKEVAFHEDIRALIEEMVRLKAHVIAPDGHFVPAPPKPSRKKNNNTVPVTQAESRSAIFDVIVEGAQEWQSKFKDFLRDTTWDPKLGYPLVKEKATSRATQDNRLHTGTILDSINENPILFDTYDDLHGDEIVRTGLGSGALGGGDEFSSGQEA
ncbi:hypothetical protein GGX14DRAFT_575693 [Mycena pura]|uniref:DUF6589 domain-containing protein n=1 Tax=Mycena pura TaxID=153505 RepID=A0AAD6UV54_9AGAR|nr:hypothetical protein GGX14DRAFT_575693 [Mycena pura]